MRSRGPNIRISRRPITPRGSIHDHRHLGAARNMDDVLKFLSFCEIGDQSFDFCRAGLFCNVRGYNPLRRASTGRGSTAARFNIRSYSSPEKPVVAFV